MRVKKPDSLEHGSRKRTLPQRGLCVLLAGFMAFQNVVPSLGTFSAYAVSTAKPVNPDGTTPNGNKPQDTIKTEEVYVNDTPLRLQVSKVKTAKGAHEGLNPKTVESTLADTITYKVSGRIEGAEDALMKQYGADQIELAMSKDGTYLGYGWLKGTLEYLTKRKLQGTDEEIDIKYNQQGIFEGYAYVTKTLETANDTNRYVAGATMTLYDALEITYNPAADYDKDNKWLGVTVERSEGSGNVEMVYVNKGYAGSRIEYVKQKEDESKVTTDENGTEVDDNYNYQDAINDKGDGVWIAKTIQREDTPILFYSFDNLHVTTNDEYETTIGTSNAQKIDSIFGSQRYNKADSVYGFDKNGNVINADQYDNRDFSIYAFEDGETTPVFEFTGGDFKNIHYSQREKMFRFYDEDGNQDKNMRMYHLDKDGNRDSLVDPTTGIAYLVESIDKKDSHDNIHDTNDDFNSDKDVKIFVWAVNTFYDGTGNADDNTKGSHYFQKIITTRPATINADTEDEYVFGTLNNGKFENSLNPVLDKNGHPVYNRVSTETYTKGSDKYDYDDEEYLGYVYEDGLDDWNENAYVINKHSDLYNGDKDDPFNQETHYQYSNQQTIKVTVDMDGNYIVNGSQSVPVPSRSGYVFAGWLVEPNALTEGKTVKAYWRNQNNTMPPEQEEKWYSQKAATGTTKEVTVTFDANGGAFRSGSGDIHSTDNVLYRRLGDAYLINNTWVTGENTPNDPFDTQKVDTVGNTAAKKNTISADGLTGNDVYSDQTTSGGQADMLKRLPRSLYIMEELSAPDGYVKAMPVAITMNENTDVQTAEMTDTTIKVEIIKVDGTENYTKNLRRNGETVKTAAGDVVTKQEEKGAYGYGHVPGAILSMKGADQATKKAFSDWVSITSCTNFTKKNNGGTWYIEFDTTKPLFLEGIPKGTYTLTEVRTPSGYVTMKPQTITVGEYEGVQLFTMADEHTKVEIEKYMTEEDGTRKLLPNASHAKLGLYDKDGTLVADWYTDDASDYTNGGTAKQAPMTTSFFAKALKAVTSMFQSKASGPDYTSFIEQFQSTYNAGSGDMEKITWNVKRTATLKAGSTDAKEQWQISDGTVVTVVNGTVPDDAPEEFKTAYADENRDKTSDTFEYPVTLEAVKDKAKTTSMGDQYWNVSNGTVMHICVSVDDDSSSAGYQSYIMDYQFDYRTLAGNAVTYLTVDGTRRFDYLPTGKYTVKEIEVPEGFAKAADKQIQVDETDDIQIFDIENCKRELKLSKYIVDGAGRYFAGYYDNEVHYTDDLTKAAVIGDVELALYRSEERITDPDSAFKDGNVPDNATLVDDFTTGKDGSYTEYEYKKELIRKEQIGQYKPHTVKDVQDGWYYLVEKQPLNYMLTAAVKEFNITSQTTDTELAGISLVNKPAPVAVKVKKTDENGKVLENAVFEISNKDTGIVVGTLVTDVNGEASMNIADTGKISKDGKYAPYTFVLKEVSAPTGYALNATQHEFTLSEHTVDGYVCEMFNNKDDALRDGVFVIEDEKSQMSISKQDFDSHLSVPGTKLELTKAVYENGTWKSDGNKKAEWTWTVDEKEDEHGLTGITPDSVYVLHEVSVPAGYTVQDDVFFHTNENGLGIDKIWFDPAENGFISFAADETGAVESMTTHTRKAVGSKAVITDLETGNSFERGIEKNGRVLLTANEVVEGHRYNIKTVVTLSDTTQQTVDSITMIAEPADGEVVIWTQAVNDSRINITDENGNVIYEIASNDSNVTILNPESDNEDSISIDDASRAGKNHSGVKAGDNITYRIDYVGKGKQIFVYPGTGLTLERTDPGTLQYKGGYMYETTKESGSLLVVASVNKDANVSVEMKATIGETTISYLNPVVVSGQTGATAENDSLVIANAVTGSDPENSTAQFQYTVTLTDQDGKALPGGYYYRTRLSNGVFYAFGKETELKAILTGNDYLVITGLNADTKYSIKMDVAASEGFRTESANTEGTIADKATVNALFTSHRSITAERALLKKNQSYYFNEILKLTDGDYKLSSYGFSLDDKCRVTNFILMNRPTNVEITKLDQKIQRALAGAVLSITDADGNVILDQNGNPLTWTTEKAATAFAGVLEAGKTYYVTETSAPTGYAVSAPIEFTVSSDGATDRIIVQDRRTDVKIKKVDSTTGEALAGAVLQVLDGENVVAEWTSDETGEYQLDGILEAGKTYVLHEKETVKGYYYSYDVEFTVNTDGSEQVVEMRNREIKVVTPPDKFPPETPPDQPDKPDKPDQPGTPDKPDDKPNTPEPDGKVYPIVWLLKGDKAQEGSTDKDIIPGGTYQVIAKADDGTETIIAEISDEDKDGQFTMDGTWKEWDVVLEADHTYYLREIKAPDGYKLPDGDVAFTVGHYGEDVQAPIYNEKIVGSFEKTDYAGTEIAGADCELSIFKNGNWEVVDRFTSTTDGPHRTEGLLIAGNDYLYKEVTAPDGYAYAVSIRFHVNADGTISNARYVDENGKSLVYGADGRPTQVIYSETLAGESYTLNGEALTKVGSSLLDANGNVIVEGAAVKLPVADNIIVMKDDPVRVSFEKTDFAGEELAGAICTISRKNADGSVTQIDRWQSEEGSAHEIANTLTANASYIYHEEATVPGYEYSYDIEFTIDKNGNVTGAHYVDENGTTILHDKDGYPTGITKSTDGTYRDGTTVITITENGDAVDADGTIHAKGIAEEIPVTGNVVVMKDAPVKAVITKYGDEKNAIAGGSYTICDENGNAIAAIRDTQIPSLIHEGMILAGEELTFAADADGVRIERLLEAGKQYQLRENEAPNGYSVNNATVSFTAPIYNQSAAIQVAMTNEKIPARFLKVTEDGTALAGASLELYEQQPDGTFTKIHEWVSTTEAEVLDGVLVYGKTYKYHEVKAPDGYKVSKDILFTIDKQGVIRNARYDGDASEVRVVNNTIQMVDPTLDVKFSKTDLNGQYLAGAEVAIGTINADGNFEALETWTTSETETSHTLSGKLQPGKTYLYRELKAPDAYAGSADIEFTVDAEGNVTKAHYVNADGNQILYDKDGYVTAITVQADGTYKNGDTDVTIDENGNATDADGNVIAEGVRAEIDVTDNTVVMKDAPLNVIIKKVDQDGVSLPGATLAVYKGKKKEPNEDHSNPYAEADKVAEWVTDDSGEFRIPADAKLVAGETYVLHESATVKGYYYSKDVEFVVNTDGKEQTVVMTNRKIIVETPPDERPSQPTPEGTTPDYTMEKERVTDAPAKKDTNKFGFFHGDLVTYEVTVKNTGDTTITMDVDDAFEIPENFTTPAIKSVRFYDTKTGYQNSGKGTLNAIDGSKANVTILAGGHVVLTYEAQVLDNAKESLSDAAKDDGKGYLNTATTSNVFTTYYEYSGEDHDGDGKGDTKTEVTKQLEDKKDDANTPVQEPTPDEPTPSYVMDKERVTEAPAKADTGKFGFNRGDVVTYAVHVTNTGDLPLKMFVTDAFAAEVRDYFKDLKIVAIDGEDISGSMDGLGIGYQTARIRVMPGMTATVTYQAVVTDEAPERLSFTAADDGNGYLNTAKTFDVKAEKPDGTEGDKTEYPGIPDKEDDANTPVQTPEEPPVTPPPTPDEPEYPVIWLMKTSVKDPSHILPGGTFQVLDEDKNPVTDILDGTAFGIGYNWNQWNIVLEAGKTYYLHEVTPPNGYLPAEDVKFTVGYYGDRVEAVMEDEPTDVIIKKTDQQTKKSLAGAVLAVYKGPKKEPYAAYDEADKVAEWTTDESGEFRLTGTLEPGATYTLHEVQTVDGYYYSYDIEFVVNADGSEQVVEMQNRKIIVETPPDELQPDTPTPEGREPEYEMEKERVTEAPAKKDTNQYGFFHGDRVTYDVTIRNTGEIALTMDVDDAFEVKQNFSTPKVHAVKFYGSASGRENTNMGSLNSVNGSKANITIKAGAYAVVTYEAEVLEKADELLSNSAPDDGLGYVNTATTTNVVGKYYEYSGEDTDGDGKGDTVTEVTVTKKDYPDKLGDKSDDANTPVQKPDKDTPTPSYEMDKERRTEAPAKDDTKKFGFHRGDTVVYDVTITNTGDLPLKMFVTDAFADEVSQYFKDLKITAIDGEDISENGMGIGTDTARIRIMPGATAVVTYTAVVSDDAPERLSFTASDDGNGYLNTAKTYNVKAEKPDGSEGGHNEYPGIPDKEDDGHTPVQTPDEPPVIPPPGPNEPEYPVIWLLKNSVNDPSHILPGGTFQVLDENKNPVTDILNGTAFGIGYDWNQWMTVLKADHTYYLHEVTPPDGYLPAEDVKFTVGHYGERVDVIMTDKKHNDGITFSKQDFSGNEVLGATCELYEVNGSDENMIEQWVSTTAEHVIKDKLESGKTYRFHESAAPDGYGYSVDVVFTVDEEGNVTDAHYVNDNGETVLYDRDGYPTEIVLNGDGTYSYKNESVTMDENGDIHDANGILLAAGTKRDIVIADNKVILKDEPTNVKIVKTDMAGNILAGGIFTILDAAKNPVKALYDTKIPSTEHDGFIRRGEKLVFKGNADGVLITKQLVVGKEYYLHEQEAPAGYAKAADQMFIIRYAKPGTTLTVTMRDNPLSFDFSKEDLGGNPVAGAQVSILKEADEVKTVVASWTTDGSAHSMTSALAAGETYIYHEDAAPNGYAMSADIEFTVLTDGNVANVHYIDENGNTVLYDENGLVTGIILKTDGTYQYNGKTVTVDDDGTAKTEDGNVIANGVKAEIEVTDNHLIMKDAPLDIVIKKEDQEGKSLAGVKLAVYKGKKLPENADHSNPYNEADKVAEWVTDDSGTFKLPADANLVVGETYVLHELETIKGYYYSRDVEFTVENTGKEQVVIMTNRKIIVEVPPDEKPVPPTPEPANPDYTMEKERVSLAPEKKDTDQFGFFHGDRVLYDVTITNTGDTTITLDVDDAFEVKENFTTPEIDAIHFYLRSNGLENSQMGSVNQIKGSKANITIKAGAYAVVTYAAVVKERADEFLSGAAKDDGLGYLNTATTTNVTTKYYEYSGEDTDGDGKGDTVTEVTKKLDDMSDTANTPVQVPEEPTPSYEMDKERTTNAPKKSDTEKYGFKRGDTVTYEVHITNTGDMALKMYVTDAFAPEVKDYFKDLKITKIKGEDISEAGMGVGTDTARIRIEAGKTATVVYTAVVTDKAPERLSFMTTDDGNGYLNIAKTYDVRAEKPDGTEGDKTEYPGIPDKEDEGHTPVQTPDEPPVTPPPTPDEPEYPVIWLMKTSVNDPSHILPGGTFQVLDEDKNPVTDILDGNEFGIGYDWKQWTGVLEAGKTYYLHEVTPPEGYQPAEDVRFTVGYYGERVEVVMKDQPTDVEIKKTDKTTGGMLAGATLQILDQDGNIVKEWITNGHNTLKLTGLLTAGETYTLREVGTPDGYYYSRDVIFTVNADGTAQTVEMKNRRIVVETPPDNFPKDEPETHEPEYTMEKERVTLAPSKAETDQYGFFHGDKVTYDVTIANTGDIALTMDVDDAFEIPENFTTPVVKAIRYYRNDTGTQNSYMGKTNAINGSVANITIESNGRAVVTYEAEVLDAAKEFLSDAAKDDGLGYLNTATTTNVTGKYYEYSGEDHDGDGKGDTVTEITVTKEQYPDKLGDKSDDANTPVQEPETGKLNPSYTMDKVRITKAPAKEGTDRFGFFAGDTVTYEAHITNTGDLPLTMTVTDEFESAAAGFFKDLKVKSVQGAAGFSIVKSGNEASGKWPGNVFIKLTPGQTATITYTATVTEKAAEKLSMMETDDGLGYLNVVKTTDVKAEKPDGSTGDSSEYPGLEDKEDTANTPVQNPKNPENPEDNKDHDYPIIWLLKNEIRDPDHILQGGTFQVLNEDKTEVVIPDFRMNGTDQRWEIVLKADHTYWLHEVTPPAGYVKAEDVKFTVSHYGERVDVVMTDEPADNTVTFTKEDFGGNDIAGAYCRLTRKGTEEVYTWISNGTPYVIKDELKAGSTYIYHEDQAPAGYGRSEDIEFTIDENGVITEAFYVDADDNHILYDRDGYQTGIIVKADGTYEKDGEKVTVDKNGNAIAKDGSILAEGVQETIEIVGNVVRMKDAPTDVTIRKVDSTTNKALAGATLAVYKGSKKAPNADYSNPYDEADKVAEWTTDDTGEFKLTQKLIAGQTYVLYEANTVDGYYYSYDVEFVVNDDGKEQVVEMRNREIKVVTPPDEFPPSTPPDKPDKPGKPDQPGTPDKPDDKPNTPEPDGKVYPIIWLLKNEVGDPDHILQGGTFQVLDEDGNIVIDNFTMNGTWQEWDIVLKADHSYYLHEVNPPAGYAKAEDVKFVVGHYGEDVQAVMTDKKTDVKIKKTDSTTGKALAGAVLEIYKGPKKEPYAAYDEADKVAEWTTDETGEFKLIGELTAGQTYTLREKATVDGYYYSYDVEFVVNDDGKEQVVEMRNREIKVVTPPDEFPPSTPPDKPDKPGKPDQPGTPDKPDDKPNTPEPDGKVYPIIWLLKNEVGDPDHILQGGTFQVLDEDGNIVIDNFTMNGTWQEWDIVLKADHSYYLHEVNPPAGYAKAEDVKFVVGHYGEDVQAVMTDKKLPTKVTFTKEDFAGNEISGADCELKRVEPNGTTTIIDQWTSDGTSHVMEDKLTGDTTYRYHEESAPDGFGYSEDIEFTVDKDGKVTNAHYVDRDGNKLLYDKDGYPTTIKVQPDGSYADGETKITIDKNGNAVDNKGNIHAEGVKLEIEVTNNVLRMKDAPTEMIFIKKSTSGSILTGGQFVICDKNGTPMRALADTAISSIDHDGTIKQGEVLRFAATQTGINITRQLAGGETYILKEEKAPAGYELASDVSFTVPRNGKQITVTMNDAKKPGGGGGGNTPTPTPKKPSVTVYKYDGNTMASIAGVRFTVYKDGNELRKVTTDQSGYAKVSDLADGSYRIVETEAAAGYKATSQEFNFTVKNESVVGGVTTFHVANYKETVVVVTKRDGDDGTALAGAQLRIVNEAGEIAYEGMTDANGQIFFPVYTAGHYAVIEVKAPKGYDVVDGYITFHVSEDGTVTGDTTMYDYKIPRKGKITAKYENGFKRGGWYDSDGRWHQLPRTGEETDNRIPFLFAISAAGLAGIVLAGRRRKKKRQ